MLAPKYCQADNRHKNTERWCKCFETPSIQNADTAPTTWPIASGLRRVSPSNSSSEATAVFLLRIDRCLGLEKPLDNGIVAVPGCVMQRCLASGAAARGPSPQAEPDGTKGRKILRKFWAPQIWKMWSLWTKEHCGFEMFWGHRVGLYTVYTCCLLLKHVAFVFYWSRVRHVGSQADLDKPKATSNIFQL